MELWYLLGELEGVQWFLIAFFGIFIGSLLNVFNYRVPHMLMYENAVMVKNNAKEVSEDTKEVLEKYKGFNLFFPNSGCPSCGHKIKWYENIPVISYIFLKGKCSSCKTSISIEYPIIELLNCFLWLGLFNVFGWTYELPFYLFASSIILSETMIDLKHKILPDTGLFILFLIPLILSSTGNFHLDTKTVILSSVFTYIIILSFINFWEKIRGFEEDIFGRGDIKYLGALAAWISIEIIDVIYYAILLGLIVYVFLAIINKKFNKDKVIPFGPMISIGFLISLLSFTPSIIEILKI